MLTPLRPCHTTAPPFAPRSAPFNPPKTHMTLQTSHTKTVLDHGFVILRNMAGPTRRPFEVFDAHDTDIANSARMSFDGMDIERSYEVEMKLNRFLMVNSHMSPFETIEVWLEMKLPIFIARQFVRHRTAGINEVSGRYVTLPADWYIPDVIGGKPVDRKQGQSDTLEIDTQRFIREDLDAHNRAGYAKYLHALSIGVAAEHARLYLQLNHYTHWLFKMDLRNLMHFLSLRQHSHAQVEARIYADATVGLLEPQIPGLMALYQDIVRMK